MYINEAFREMQDRLELRGRDPVNIMTNYRGRVGFYAPAWLDLQFTTFVSPMYLKFNRDDSLQVHQVCRLHLRLMMPLMILGSDVRALRCNNVAASHECTATLVAA